MMKFLDEPYALLILLALGMILSYIGGGVMYHIVVYLH